MSQKIKLILVTCMLTAISAKAQNFNYRVQADTNQSYVDISDTTAITLPQIDDVAKLPIGFPFTFAGKSFDIIKIRTTGTFTFDTERKYNFMFLNKDFIYDTEGAKKSSIVYKTEKVGALPVLKIQFKNMLLPKGKENIYLNFQVWLYQYTNAIEFHMGKVDGTLANETCMMGLINTNNADVAAVGYLLQGKTTNPTATLINAKGKPVELNSFPKEGTVYKFIAN